MTGFGDRVVRAVAEKGSPICVGIDPRPDLLPPEVLERAGPGRLAEAFRLFGCEVIDLVAARVAAVKPQVAFFEPLLGPGLDAFAAVCRHGRERGLVVIADTKRGDIGSTAEAYARACFTPLDGEGPVADACTVNPLFGSDGVRPFLDAALPGGGGLFVLVRTSNPSAEELQDLEAGSRPVHAHVAALVERWNAPTVGESGYGAVGAVVGATRPDLLARLRRALPSSILLLPGYGAQGAGAADVAGAFDARGGGALVSASRSLTFPWAGSGRCPEAWREAIAEAVEAMRRDLGSASGERA